MAGISFSAKVDASGPLELFNNSIPRNVGTWIKRGAGAAAVEVQDMMRDELDRLIYSTPEPLTKRTWTLFRSTYASRPGADHSRDHQAAAGGVDLRVDKPAAGGVARLTGMTADIEVGAWANYAEFVHEGNAPNGARTPKPFTIRPAEEANHILTKEVNTAVAEGLASLIR